VKSHPTEVGNYLLQICLTESGHSTSRSRPEGRERRCTLPGSRIDGNHCSDSACYPDVNVRCRPTGDK